MAGRRSLYVETMIRSDLDMVWRLTQDPLLHARWDARFGRIEYLPRSAGEPQRFRYATAVLPGIWVHGVGTSVGERWRADGSCTSVLCFGSEHPLSPILEGSGYWRYTPGDGGVRFLTGYDYRTRWGRAGAIVDAAFRPVMGWATAWSFDRLRLWAERGLEPERSRRRAVLEIGVRAAAVLGAMAVAARTGRPGVLAGVAVAAVAVPPMPGTPAARRCRRRPPDRLSATPPDRLLALTPDRVSVTPPDRSVATAPDQVSATPPDLLVTTPPDRVSSAQPGRLVATAPDRVSAGQPDGAPARPDSMASLAADRSSRLDDRVTAWDRLAAERRQSLGEVAVQRGREVRGR